MSSIDCWEQYLFIGLKVVGLGISMLIQQTIMDQKIITEQIDVAVIGERKLELIALMLEKELLPQQAKRKHTHTKYLELLGKLVRDPVIPESSSSNFPLKFTKVILTNTFWFHIHFFVHDNKVFDPFVSQACRGSINICIIAASEGTDLTATKAYLLQQSISRPLENTIKDGGIVRPETIVQAKVMSTAHEIAVGGFPAVIALKMTNQKRLIQQSSNLRLSVNQLVRWIVDRHFYTKHKVTIKPELLDEIETYRQNPQKYYCSLI